MTFYALLAVAEKIQPGIFVKVAGNPAFIEEKLVRHFQSHLHQQMVLTDIRSSFLVDSRRLCARKNKLTRNLIGLCQQFFDSSLTLRCTSDFYLVLNWMSTQVCMYSHGRV